MKIQSIVASACIAALGFTATSALAQAQPQQQQQQAPQITHGPAVAGICTIDPQASILATNAVQAVERKINSEFAAEGQKLQQELQPYANNPQSTPEALRKKVQDLQTRIANRRNNLQPAERQAQERIAAEVTPTITEIYQQRRCSLLIDSGVLVIPNPAMDITRAVVDRLNQKVPAPAGAPAAPAATQGR
ncbi:MAG: OmpH family outer membrane protein [Phenylobacterium sp.]|jgi:outer membrane protein|uniref:OmpH family outer membrane protein n=1 Tax=Phenylobacterium sp. TaxID=1871053 RepID=UPI002A371553|nr:OmpH family outer membrane protein [Phenylobacterium sp.]MDX9996777.1 OmpH family outer membrane protein [Phenylobacterium sp.]